MDEYKMDKNKSYGYLFSFGSKDEQITRLQANDYLEYKINLQDPNDSFIYFKREERVMVIVVDALIKGISSFGLRVRPSERFGSSLDTHVTLLDDIGQLLAATTGLKTKSIEKVEKNKEMCILRLYFE